VLVFHRRAAEQRHERAVTVLVLREQHERQRLGGQAVGRWFIIPQDAELHARNRLNAEARELFGKLQRTKHGVGIGEGERRLVIAKREFAELRQGQRAFKQRVRAVRVEMNEGHGGCHVTEIVSKSRRSLFV
jgi:hypothetical protein